jgi:hypothetical protein
MNFLRSLRTGLSNRDGVSNFQSWIGQSRFAERFAAVHTSKQGTAADLARDPPLLSAPS